MQQQSLIFYTYWPVSFTRKTIKMDKAILYIRVSTDEQADKGYSQRHQQEMLEKYCQQQGITIVRSVFEDHSAKSFKRPGWNGMLQKLNSRKSAPVNLILFTKWDRFSRNAADAYQMIAILRKLGIEPQAIEQPLDLSVPENKMMLAFYLAAPEVENDRRALNIFFGIRRAKKEGRWTNGAPIGYLNKNTENGRKYICIDPIQGKLMTEGFEELARARYNIDQVWKLLKKKGLRCQRNNFHTAIRNPVYCGKILVPAFKDEPLQLVKGQHENLITAELFDEVQYILDGRKKKQLTTIVTRGELPLRGFLICPRCCRMLTGSASKGRNVHYHYYHCSSHCGERQRADSINELFIGFLKKFRPNPAYYHLFKQILIDSTSYFTANERSQTENLKAQVNSMEIKINQAKALMVAGDIEIADFMKIKTELEPKFTALQQQLAQHDDPLDKVKQKMEKLENHLLKVGSIYSSASIEAKRVLLAYLFPTNLSFQEGNFQFSALAPALKIVYKNLPKNT
jgi:site-specific DNA recombinase